MRLAGVQIAIATAFVVWNLADGAIYDGRMLVAILLLLVAFARIIMMTQRRIAEIENRKEQNR